MILSYGCSTSAGPDVDAFWNRLQGPPPESRPLWPLTEGTANESSLDILTRHCLAAWEQCSSAVVSELELGIIFASTKGCIDDWIWGPSPELSPQFKSDSLTPVLENFIEKSRLKPREAICVSNACSSSLTALWLARQWLAQKRVKQVLVLAADRAGAFVQKGFETLKILSPTRARPFDAARDGLWLGDGAAAILVGDDSSQGFARIAAIATETEGHAVTRPSETGDSLKRVIRSLSGREPDLIIAHGTGTLVNDATEDAVFTAIYGAGAIPVTGTKWCIGHTLGASAAMDVIAACEAIRRGSAFHLGALRTVDPKLGSRFVTGPLDLRPRRVLVSSLGFGGIHAAAMIEGAS